MNFFFKKSKKLLHCRHRRIITLGVTEKGSNYVSSALFIHQQKMSVHNLDNSVYVNISLKLMWLRGCGNTGSGTHRCLHCRSRLPDKTNRQTKGTFLRLDTEIGSHINSAELSERNKRPPTIDHWQFHSREKRTSLSIRYRWICHLLFEGRQGNPSGTFRTKSRCSIK